MKGERTRKRRRSFGRIALDKGYLEQEALQAVLDQQRRIRAREVDARLGELLLLTGGLSVEQLFDVLGEQLEQVRVCSACERSFRVARSKGKQARCPECGERTVRGEPPTREEVERDVRRLARRLDQADRRRLARLKQACFARPGEVQRLQAQKQKALSGGHRRYRPAADAQPAPRPAPPARAAQARPDLRRASTRFRLRPVERRRGPALAPVLEPAPSRRGWLWLAVVLVLAAGVGLAFWRRAPEPAPADSTPAPVARKASTALAIGPLVLVEQDLALALPGGRRVFLVGQAHQEAFAHMRRFLDSGGEAVHLEVRGRLLREAGQVLIEVAEWRRVPAQPARMEEDA